MIDPIKTKDGRFHGKVEKVIKWNGKNVDLRYYYFENGDFNPEKSISVPKVKFFRTVDDSENMIYSEMTSVFAPDMITVQKKYFIYDFANRLREVITQEESNNVIQKIKRSIYVYDLSGNLTQITEKYGDDVESVVKYQYDYENRLVRSELYENGSSTPDITEYLYEYMFDPVNLVKETMWHGSEIYKTVDYYYDSDNNIIRKISTDTEDGKRNTTVNEYSDFDEHGNFRHEEVFEDGRRSVYDYKIKYYEEEKDK